MPFDGMRGDHTSRDHKPEQLSSSTPLEHRPGIDVALIVRAIAK